MKKTITCKTCGKEIASSAKTCPECGAKNKKPFYKKWWFWLIVVIVVVALASPSENKTTNTPSNSTTNEVTKTENNVEKTEQQDEQEELPQEPKEEQKEIKNNPKISKSEFEALSTGITYEQAVEIIGGEGELSSQVDVAGYNTVIYIWRGEGSIGANANVTFQNNKLVAKAQAGLK